MPIHDPDATGDAPAAAAMNLRVLHVGKYLPPHPGGMERFLDDLIRAQAEQGLAPAAVFHRMRGGTGSQLQVPLYPVPVLGETMFVPLSPGFPAALARAIREHRPHLLHLHVPNLSAFSALALPAARRLPWVLQWQADVPRDMPHAGVRALRRLYGLPERALLRRSRAVVLSTPHYLESSSVLQDFRARCRVIPLGMPDTALPPSRRPPDDRHLRVLAVGRLTYYKGFEVLLRALARVPQAELDLIGGGEGEAGLRALAVELGLGERLRLLGRVDDAALAQAYADCDVFCLPSLDRAESFGLVLLEAMRASRAVVASRITGSGVNHVVSEGETALQVPPGDVEALTAALARLAAEPALRERLGAAGRRRFEREFDIRRCAEQLETLYREVLLQG